MIDTQAIKNKILDLAMRGQLTEQLPEDGTAEELYHQIQANRLKSTKSKPLQNIKNEEAPSVIPSNWMWIRLGNLVDVLGGKRIPAGRKLTTENTGHKYIRVSDMKNLSVDTSKLMYVPDDIYPSISRYIIKKEDVYITVAGTIGRVGTIPDELDGANLTENADRLVFSVLNKNWLVFCLASNVVQKQIDLLTTQVAQPKLAIKRIQEFCIPLPPLVEQKRIVDKIDQAFSVLDTVDALQAQYANNLTTLKAKLIDAAIQGKLTEQLPEDGTAEELYEKIQTEKQALIKAGKIKKEKPLPEISDDEIPFDIPENWKWIRLRDFGAFSGGKTPSMRHKGYWENGVVSWITSKDMKQKYIASSEMLISEIAAKEMAIHPEKTVLFVVRSGILRRMFPVAILTERGTINQDLKALELYIPDMCEYVYYVLKGFEHTILFKYTKDGTTVNNIIFDALLTMPIPLPPVAEQKRIAERLDLLMSTIEQ